MYLLFALQCALSLPALVGLVVPATVALLVGDMLPLLAVMVVAVPAWATIALLEKMAGKTAVFGRYARIPFGAPADLVLVMLALAGLVGMLATPWTALALLPLTARTSARIIALPFSPGVHNDRHA